MEMRRCQLVFHLVACLAALLPALPPADAAPLASVSSRGVVLPDPGRALRRSVLLQRREEKVGNTNQPAARVDQHTSFLAPISENTTFDPEAAVAAAVPTEEGKNAEGAGKNTEGGVESNGDGGNKGQKIINYQSSKVTEAMLQNLQGPYSPDLGPKLTANVPEGYASVVGFTEGEVEFVSASKLGVSCTNLRPAPTEYSRRARIPELLRTA